MTEELTPDFELFSEMLDQEDSPTQIPQNSEAKLLLELRQVLRNQADEADLPADFAAETAKTILTRYQNLPWFQRLRGQAQHKLLSQAFRGPNLWKSLSLLGLGSGAAMAGYHWLLVFGSLLGVLSLAWMVSEKAWHAPWRTIRKAGCFSNLSGSDALNRALFYSVPLLALVTTSLLAGAGLKALSQLSLSFRENKTTMTVAAAATSIGFFILILNACLPLWRAYSSRAANHRYRYALFQLTHTLWAGAGLFTLLKLLSIFPQSSVPSTTPTQALWVLSVFALVSFVWVVRFSKTCDNLPSLAQARRSFASSILFSFVPIALTLSGLFHLNLTKEITSGDWEKIKAEGSAWIKKEEAIPDQDNGWIELRPFLVRTEETKKENQMVAKRFKSLGSEHFKQGRTSFRDMDPKERALFEENKKVFLSEIERIDSALSKPRFSHLPTEGSGFEKLIPNFITYRAISQGLALLAQESFANNDMEAFVDYSERGLKWASKAESATLIELMIEVACSTIAQEPLEEAVLSGKLSDQQLKRLGAAISKSRPERGEFKRTMLRDTILVDQMFTKILKNGTDQEDSFSLPPLFSLLPKSYWESERKAYLNLQLSQVGLWNDLSLEGKGLSEEDINPFNVMAAYIVPNLHRAKIKFCYYDSQLASCELMIALQRYKLAQGNYPPTLQNLLPRYLQTLPQDLMDRQKETFQYQTTPAGYELVSESKAYESLKLDKRQVYGHDGKLDPESLVVK